MNSNAYMAEYMNRRYHQRRARAIAILGGCCVICGSTESLEIDHADRATKLIDLGRRWSTSESAYLAELAKCQLLCRQHHKEKSANEASVAHGGGVSGKRNCKCAPCRARKSEYNRNYRMRQATA